MLSPPQTPPPHGDVQRGPGDPEVLGERISGSSHPGHPSFRETEGRAGRELAQTAPGLNGYVQAPPALTVLDCGFPEGTSVVTHKVIAAELETMMENYFLINGVEIPLLVIPSWAVQSPFPAGPSPGTGESCVVRRVTTCLENKPCAPRYWARPLSLGPLKQPLGASPYSR